jgi:hypothetical protein
VTETPLQIAAELARLQAENARLLKLSQQQAAPPRPAGGLFEAPPGPVHDGSPETLARLCPAASPSFTMI